MTAPVQKTSAEEEHTQATKRLTIFLVGLAVFDALIIGAGIVYASVTNNPDSLSVLAPILVVLGFSASLLIIFFVGHLAKLQELFWKEAAETLGYAYMRGPALEKKALVFRQGHSQRAGHGLMGHFSDENPFRLFQYQYTQGHGKSSETHSYTVLEVTFSGTFPHLYFNNTKNRNLETGEFFLPRISLPSSLEKRFNMYGPKGYEIEALEIFTPDVLAALDQGEWRHDFELVDQKMYVFCEKSMRTKADIVDEIARLKSLMERLQTKLNRFKFTPVGTLSHSL